MIHFGRTQTVRASAGRPLSFSGRFDLLSRGRSNSSRTFHVGTSYPLDSGSFASHHSHDRTACVRTRSRSRDISFLRISVLFISRTVREDVSLSTSRASDGDPSKRGENLADSSRAVVFLPQSDVQGLLGRILYIEDCLTSSSDVWVILLITKYLRVKTVLNIRLDYQYQAERHHTRFLALLK